MWLTGDWSLVVTRYVTLTYGFNSSTHPWQLHRYAGLNYARVASREGSKSNWHFFVLWLIRNRSQRSCETVNGISREQRWAESREKEIKYFRVKSPSIRYPRRPVKNNDMEIWKLPTSEDIEVCTWNGKTMAQTGNNKNAIQDMKIINISLMEVI